MRTPVFLGGGGKSNNKIWFGSIPSNSRFCHSYRQVIEYGDSITYRPRIIGYYRKPIRLPLMITYTESEVEIGYIEGKTITIRFWSFSMRIFTTHPADNQRN